MRIAFTLLCLGLAALSVPAKSREIHSGTGFFVSRQGYIITNEHVVRGCSKVAVRGAVNPVDGIVAATDPEVDLAIVQIPGLPDTAAVFRDEDDPVEADEDVMVMGYPEHHALTGQYAIARAKTVTLPGVKMDENYVAFSDAARQGNSGGPLLDKSGLTIGVIAAKGRMSAINSFTQEEIAGADADLAISLKRLTAFLDSYGVPYETRRAGSNLTADLVQEQASQYIVNIHCQP